MATARRTSSPFYYYFIAFLYSEMCQSVGIYYYICSYKIYIFYTQCFIVSNIRASSILACSVHLLDISVIQLHNTLHYVRLA